MLIKEEGKKPNVQERGKIFNNPPLSELFGLFPEHEKNSFVSLLCMNFFLFLFPDHRIFLAYFPGRKKIIKMHAQN